MPRLKNKMSKIGKNPIQVPEGVIVEIKNRTVNVKGPKGEGSVELPSEIEVSMDNQAINVKPKTINSQTKPLWGTLRSLVANMVDGVVNNFSKTLQIVGTGYRANVSGGELVLNVGFSHEVKVKPPEGITIQTEDDKIIISGANKQLVGQVAASIRDVKRPDVYQGKGIRYENEVVKLKPGKAAKTAE